MAGHSDLAGARAALALLALAPTAACAPKVLNFAPVEADGEEICAADPGWLPSPAEPGVGTPAPHPVTECPFYYAGFQHFLAATEAISDGIASGPRMAWDATPDDLFKPARPLPADALAPPGTRRGTMRRAWLGRVHQPGSEAVLVDQDHHALYYGVHVNQAFAEFVRDNALDTVSGIMGADPALQLPAGAVLMRSAWKDVDPADGVTGDYSRYVTTTAWVSRIDRDPISGAILELPDQPRQIRVALVALHVAYGLRGHPELIWTTFEHADGAGGSDVAPAIDSNPNPIDLGNLTRSSPVAPGASLLYLGGTPANLANVSLPDPSLTLDRDAQTLAPATSVYRVFPASRSHTIGETSAITSLNKNVAALFADKVRSGQVGGDDPRAWYRLVGGLWMDKPGFFAPDATLQNDATSPMVTGIHISQEGTQVPPVRLSDFQDSIVADGTDSELSILAGSDRLSSTAMEAFTQAPGQFVNCLTCHNTKSISNGGTPFDARTDPDPVALGPKMINVARLFARFVTDQCGLATGCPMP